MKKFEAEEDPTASYDISPYTMSGVMTEFGIVLVCESVIETSKSFIAKIQQQYQKQTRSKNQDKVREIEELLSATILDLI